MRRILVGEGEEYSLMRPHHMAYDGLPDGPPNGLSTNLTRRH